MWAESAEQSLLLLILIRMGAAGVTPSPPLSMQNFSLLVVTITTAAIYHGYSPSTPTLLPVLS
jgi:hypothetical protein